MSAHTPGPWTDDEAGLVGSNGAPVGKPAAGRPLMDEVARVQADRRLIAAAPDLLAAALAMMEADRALHDSAVKHDEWDPLDRKAIALLGAAIAKATAP